MHETSTAPEKSRLLPLALAALGVVYGDIGTSPLYAIRECFFGEHGVEPNRGNVLGVLSIIFWTLIVVVTLKYHVYVIRADNRGEGGILALMALVRSKVRGWSRRWLVAVGLFGAALLYADGVLTPAISVLGAVEGISVVQPTFGRLVVPMSIAILIGLFLLPAPRDRWGRLGLRAGHAGLVRHDRGAGRRGHRPRPLRARRHQSDPRGALPGRGRRRRPPRSRRDLPGRDRGRGALCGPRAFRREADPDRLVLPGRGLFDAQLLRAGRSAALRRRSRPQPVLSPRSRLGTPAPARSRHHGRDHRLAGDHLRFVLSDAPGGPARLPAADRDRSHLGERDRSDLRPGGQLAACRGDGRSGDRFPHLEQRGQRLRRGADHHDVDHHSAGVPGGGQDLALEPMARRPGDGGVSRSRPRLLDRRDAEDSGRRLVPPRRRARGSRAAPILGAGPIGVKRRSRRPLAADRKRGRRHRA